jgi:hypothetical protein
MQAEIPDGYASLQKEPHQRGSGGAEGGRWTHLGWPSRSIRPRPHDARVTVGALAQAVNGPNHTRRWERAGWGRRATVPVPGAQWRTVSNRVADSEGKARSRVLNGGDNRARVIAKSPCGRSWSLNRLAEFAGAFCGLAALTSGRPKRRYRRPRLAGWSNEKAAPFRKRPALRL